MLRCSFSKRTWRLFCAQWDATIFDTNSYGVPCIVGQYHPFFASHVDLHCISCQISQLIDVLEILQETMWGFSSFNVSTIHSIPGNLPTLRSLCWYMEYASPFLVQFPMWSVETTNHPTSPTTSFFLCVLTINQRVPCSCSHTFYHHKMGASKDCVVYTHKIKEISWFTSPSSYFRMVLAKL